MADQPVRSSLQIAIHQSAPRLHDPEVNRALMQDRITDTGADLHLFPELSLTGYDLGTRVGEFAIEEGAPPPLRVADDSVAVMGFPLRARDGRLFNAAGAVRGDRWQTLYRKVYLPTYGMFDEGRHFAPGRWAPEVFDVAGFRVAIAICEDLWHPAVGWLAAMQGVDLLVCPVAAAGRGFRSPTGDSRFASAETWVTLARAMAIQHGMALAVGNRVGVEGNITFAGGSFAVSPGGEVVGRASDGAEETLLVTITAAEIAEARRPFSHLRDDDPQWVRREIERLDLAPPPPADGN